MVAQSTSEVTQGVRTVSATEARVHLGEVLRAVREQGEDVIIERGGKPIAAFISMDDYQVLLRHRREKRTGAWAKQATELRAAIAAEWQGPPLGEGDVEEMIEHGQR